jgi:hypothetical protein
LTKVPDFFTIRFVPTRRLAISSCATLLLVVCSAPLLQADWSFYDGTFNNADWRIDVLVFTTPGVSSGGGGQQILSGNPPPSMEATETFGGVTPSGDLAKLVFGFFFSESLYNPGAQGAIAEVSFSYDVIEQYTTGPMVGVDLVLFQNGVYYSRTLGPDLTGSAAWVSFSHADLVASDFTNIQPNGLQGTQHPVFSDQGSPIQFGFLIGGESGRTDTISCDVDNFSVVVVPEPAPAALLVLSLFGVLSYKLSRSVNTRKRMN